MRFLKYFRRLLHLKIRIKKELFNFKKLIGKLFLQLRFMKIGINKTAQTIGQYKKTAGKEYQHKKAQIHQLTRDKTSKAT